MIKQKRSNKIKSSLGDRISITGIYIFAGLIGIICILPFLYVVGGSFATEKELTEKAFLIVPSEISLNAYKFIIDDGRIFNGLKNSIIVTVWGNDSGNGYDNYFCLSSLEKRFPGQKPGIESGNRYDGFLRGNDSWLSAG